MLITGDKLRLTGFSGLDTETMVEKLMQAEHMKADKMKQKLQVLKWQQEGYREMTNLLRGFKDKYLDILSKDNLISATSFQAFSTSVKLNGFDTDAVKVESTSGAALGSHTIKVNQLAQKEVWESTGNVSGDMVGNVTPIDWSKLANGKTFDVTLDGVRKTITLSGNYSNDLTNLETELQTSIDNAFGEGNIIVSNDGTNIKFTAEGHTFKISDSVNTYVSSLGFRNNQTNSIIGNGLKFPLDLSDGSFKISVNETQKEITFPNGTTYDSIEALAEGLEDVINGSEGFDRNVVKVEVVDNRLKIISYDSSDTIKLNNSDTNNILSKLGFNNNSRIEKFEGAADINVSEIGKEFDIYIDGTQTHIELTDEITSIEDLAEKINEQVTGLTVISDGDKLIFSGTNGQEIRISNSIQQTVSALGFENGDTNNLNVGDSLSKAFGINTDTTFEINGVSFTFKSTDTVKSVMDKINNSGAGVTISYNSVSDKFMLQADKEGAANKIVATDNALIQKIFDPQSTGESYITQKAADAEIVLDGISTKRSSNKFTVDGLEYTLNEITDAEVEIKVTSDPEKLVTKIKDFVTAYNELISKIHLKTSEDRKKSGKYEYYEPLTEEQKKDMSDKDIELWEEAAKAGLLKNDATLQKITDSMRRALYDAVEGVGIHIFDIGITTSREYIDKGQLVIDEQKLRKAIEENPNEIAELFTNRSSIPYDNYDRATRYQENGLSSRLLDIVDDNIRTTVNSKGYRGILIEKAGIENTVSNVNNMMSKEIDRQNEEIDRLMERLADKENNYFLMFSRMEAAMQAMNNQSAFLANQMGGWQ